MRRGEARIGLQWATQWQERGMFKPGAFDAIQKELGDAGEGPSLAQQSLYAVGGLMLGAATAALYGVLRLYDLWPERQEMAWYFFMIAAVVLLGAAMGVHLARQVELGDALILAGLVPLAITLGPDAVDPLLWLLPMAFGLTIVGLRREARLVPSAALALSLVAWPVFLMRALDGDTAAAATPWFVLAVGLWGGMVAWQRYADLPWEQEGLTFTTLNVAAAWLMVVEQIIDPGFDAGVEVVFGLGLLALLGAGLLLKERAITALAGALLTIDAVVFAFDIGGPATGLTVLLAMAAALIVAGALLRRRAASLKK